MSKKRPFRQSPKEGKRRGRWGTRFRRRGWWGSQCRRGSFDAASCRTWCLKQISRILTSLSKEFHFATFRTRQQKPWEISSGFWEIGNNSAEGGGGSHGCHQRVWFRLNYIGGVNSVLSVKFEILELQNRVLFLSLFNRPCQSSRSTAATFIAKKPGQILAVNSIFEQFPYHQCFPINSIMSSVNSFEAWTLINSV